MSKEKVGAWLWMLYWAFVAALLAGVAFVGYSIWREAT